MQARPARRASGARARAAVAADVDPREPALPEGQVADELTRAAVVRPHLALRGLRASRLRACALRGALGRAEAARAQALSRRRRAALLQDRGRAVARHDDAVVALQRFSP